MSFDYKVDLSVSGPEAATWSKNAGTTEFPGFFRLKRQPGALLRKKVWAGCVNVRGDSRAIRIGADLSTEGRPTFHDDDSVYLPAHPEILRRLASQLESLASEIEDNWETIKADRPMWYESLEKFKDSYPDLRL